MHILFVIDPLEELAAYKDTSVSMIKAVQLRGHTVSVAYQNDLFIDHGIVMARYITISIPTDADLYSNSWWVAESNPQDAALSEFSAVIMRKDPPFDLEYFYSTHLFDYAKAQGARVFNSGSALRNHPEKLAITEFNEFTAPTLVTSSMSRIKDFYIKHGDIVVKPLDGMGGSGVFRIKQGDSNLSSILETLTGMGANSIMAQKYIPDISNGDKRILIIGGEVIPYCLARIPLAGESRGNLAAGGRGVARPLTNRDLEIANAVAQKLYKRGLFVIGLDIIGNYLTEVNVTSPTCFVEIAEQTDCNVPEVFAIALEKELGA